MKSNNVSVGDFSMVRYTVLWREQLVAELANLWATYHNRSELTAAVDQIDVILSVDAHSKGNIFRTSLRTISSGPFTVFFRVDEGDRKVTVEDIMLTESN
jgi:hypothetical protein